jgi:hypothetical protein
MGKPMPHIGTDFSLATETGWNATVRMNLYSEPGLDYGEVELRGSGTFSHPIQIADYCRAVAS